MNAKSSVWLIHWIGEKLIRHPKNWYLCGFADEVNTALLSLREIWLMEVVKSLKILYCILDLAFWQWTRLSVQYRVGYNSWKLFDLEWRSVPIQAILSECSYVPWKMKTQELQSNEDSLRIPILTLLAKDWYYHVVASVIINACTNECS